MNKLFHRYARSVTTVIIILLFSISLWQLAVAGWIQGKALVAQKLLNHSWNKTLLHAKKSDPHESSPMRSKPSFSKPWPWADTWPVAKLRVPQYGIEQIILAGDSGNSLAFGPGYSFAGAEPNTYGTTVVSAHRDTHFQFLKNLKINDTVYLQTMNKNISYRIIDIQIVDSNSHVIPNNPDEITLILATCYPFEAVTAGGSLRYLVYTTMS